MSLVARAAPAAPAARKSARSVKAVTVTAKAGGKVEVKAAKVASVALTVGKCPAAAAAAAAATANLGSRRRLRTTPTGGILNRAEATRGTAGSHTIINYYPPKTRSQRFGQRGVR
jgi:hypothetical protein